MVFFEQPNLTNVNTFVDVVTIDVVGEEFEKNMFGVGASIEESSCALIIKKLSMFKRLPILPFACVDPLAWWCIHEGQFSDMGFLVKHFFWNLGFTNRN
jgi:hypothetical protein